MKGRFDLAGKTALITGSSQGLGFTFARGLAEAGATVVLNARGRDKLEVAADKLRKDGFSVHTSEFDVTDSRQIGEAMAALAASVPVVDILVNNAGIHRRAPLEQMDEMQWRSSDSCR